MTEPNLNEFGLDEQQINRLEIIEQKRNRRKSIACFILAMILYGLYAILLWILGGKYPIVSICIYLVWMIPAVIAGWIVDHVGSYLLLSSQDYDMYVELHERKNRFDIAEKAYCDYFEKLQEEKSRTFINQNLPLILELKQVIFNKQISESNYADFTKFENAIESLSDHRKNMSWNEKLNFDDSERYLQSRKHGLINISHHRIEEKKPQVAQYSTENIKVEDFKDQENEIKNYNRKRTFIGRKVDFEEVDRKKTSLGINGERAVVDYEKRLLIKSNRTDLAQKIKHVSDVEGSGTGYDILSFDNIGNPKYIEVKTTTGPKTTPFILSQNELAFMEQEGENYYLYRLCDFDEINQTGSLIITKGYDQFIHSFRLTPSQYKVDPNRS